VYALKPEDYIKPSTALLSMSLRKHRVLYVGGLDEQVSEEILHAAFIPFGDLRSVQVPKDFSKGTSRGFGFVEYELEEDCAAALDNMNGAELFGKTLKCSFASPPAKKIASGVAVWSAEDFLAAENNNGEEGIEEEAGEEAASLAPS